MRKTILITDFHPFVSRNILGTRFFEMLQRQPNVRLVIICPEKKKDFLEKEYGVENVLVYGVPGRIRRIDAFFKDMALAAVHTRSLRIMKKMRIGFERAWLVNFLALFARPIRSAIPFLYRIVMPRRAYGNVFEKYQPTLVFSTDVFGSADSRITHEAKCRGIKTVGMVRSWDNLTTKGGFRVISDVLVVNNEIIKKEAEAIHGICSDIIRIIGIPHYDRYNCAERNSLKEKFSALGKKIILYSPLGDRIIKVGEGEVGKGFDDGMIRLLAGSIPDSHILFVRLPPTDTVFLSEKELPQNVQIERPGTQFGRDGKAIKVTELSRADDARLIETICASDLVLTVFSSIAVDALALGKPVILLGFDTQSVSYWKSVARLHELDHLRPLIEGGIATAYDTNALRKAVESFLRHPKLDAEKRKRVADMQMYTSDRQSSERLLEVVLGALKS